MRAARSQRSGRSHHKPCGIPIVAGRRRNERRRVRDSRSFGAGGTRRPGGASLPRASEHARAAAPPRARAARGKNSRASERLANTSSTTTPACGSRSPQASHVASSLASSAAAGVSTGRDTRATEGAAATVAARRHVGERRRIAHCAITSTRVPRAPCGRRARALGHVGRRGAGRGAWFRRLSSFQSSGASCSVAISHTRTRSYCAPRSLDRFRTRAFESESDVGERLAGRAAACSSDTSAVAPVSSVFTNVCRIVDLFLSACHCRRPRRRLSTRRLRRRPTGCGSPAARAIATSDGTTMASAPPHRVVLGAVHELGAVVPEPARVLICLAQSTWARIPAAYLRALFDTPNAHRARSPRDNGGRDRCQRRLELIRLPDVILSVLENSGVRRDRTSQLVKLRASRRLLRVQPTDRVLSSVPRLGSAERSRSQPASDS